MPYKTVKKLVAPKYLGTIYHRGEHIRVHEAYVGDEEEHVMRNYLSIFVDAFKDEDVAVLREKKHETEGIWFSEADDTLVFSVGLLEELFPLAFANDNKLAGLERCMDEDLFQEFYKLRLKGDTHLDMHGTGLDMFLTTHDRWDCECKTEYIHSICLQECSMCHVRQEDAPDSRLTEVLQEKGYKV